MLLYIVQLVFQAFYLQRYEASQTIEMDPLYRMGVVSNFPGDVLCSQGMGVYL
jgi:hypothetical protein